MIKLMLKHFPSFCKKIEDEKEHNAKLDDDEEEEIEVDLYGILHVDKQATSMQLKQAYKKLALKYHPDKNRGENQNATECFQIVSFIHELLSDKKRRHAYDATGVIEEDIFSTKENGEMRWEEYWRLLFPKITQADLLQYEKKYRGSQEEVEDVLHAYENFKGDMKKIMEVVVLSNEYQDEDRFRDIIGKAIADGRVKEYDLYQQRLKVSKAQRKRAQKEEVEALDLLRLIQEKNQNRQMNTLAQARKHDFDSMVANLESKYAKPTSKRKKKNDSSTKSSNLPSEEEFLAIQSSFKPPKK